jgi:hypothetical protein
MVRIAERNLAAFDHRHPLAVQHFQLLRALLQTHENDEHPGKHAEDEDGCEQFGRHTAPILPTGEIRLAAVRDCFSRRRRNKTLGCPL